ncbi:AlkZ family DNA glycosylase [Leucobacter sp. CSA2]|uniref:AlkZ family DNA glycosylase n=1 Tax=Leucobacter edaphi TaxID=2796472 RepID=A0A934UX79_9MICO|nr:winged helix DNA-binding domain-containing protein [Leucobacter edaphi]MBK0422464.1 AlkZ family DNA glycosylase [Leucobacter edaphi]
MNLRITSRELLGLRTRALGIDAAAPREPLAGRKLSPVEGIAETASRMLAVQGQDWRSARWALGLRTPGTSLADVHEAFSSGRIVRSWPMRGTIHVLAAEDIGWIQRALNHRVLAGAPKRRQTIGMSDAALERIVEVSLAAIRAGDGIDRDQLSTAWTEAGIEWQAAWRYHAIWWLCQNGLAVFGPVRAGGEPLLVDAERWIPRPRILEGEDALAELAARYAVGRGPIRERDFAWWTGLTLTQARAAIAHAAEADRLQPLSLDGAAGRAGELWAAPEQLEWLGERQVANGSEEPTWRLLPAFDEHLLGYTDREPQLAPEHFDRIVPGRNGMFLATIVRGGEVVGTWRRPPRKTSGIELSPFPGHTVPPEELREEAARWARFHALELPAPVTA